MCLACEMDALWYAEWERLAAEGAAVPAASEDAAGAEGPALTESAEASATALPPPASLGGAGSLPQSQLRKRAEETGAPPARAAAPRSGFHCEETE
jgi:hypothetical protein